MILSLGIIELAVQRCLKNVDKYKHSLPRTFFIVSCQHRMPGIGLGGVCRWERSWKRGILSIRRRPSHRLAIKKITYPNWSLTSINRCHNSREVRVNREPYCMESSECFGTHTHTHTPSTAIFCCCFWPHPSSLSDERNLTGYCIKYKSLPSAPSWSQEEALQNPSPQFLSSTSLVCPKCNPRHSW